MNKLIGMMLHILNSFHHLNSIDLLQGRIFLLNILDYLYPPDGGNLLQILLSNKELRSSVSQIFNECGFEVVLKSDEDKIYVLKRFEEGILVLLPYSILSDTIEDYLLSSCNIYK